MAYSLLYPRMINCAKCETEMELKKGKKYCVGCSFNIKSTQEKRREIVNTPTYQTWLSMRARHRHDNLIMDPRWKSFDVFYKDMGPKPEGTIFKRLDRKKGFNKNNCRYVIDIKTKEIQ